MSEGGRGVGGVVEWSRLRLVCTKVEHSPTHLYPPPLHLSCRGWMFGDRDEYPSKVLDNLYCGTYKHARNAHVRLACGITHVVDVESGGSRPDNLDPALYCASPMCDFGSTDVGVDSSMLARTLEFIARALDAGGVVLVQCEWGVNRSATMTCAFLVVHRDMSLLDAAITVKTARPVTRPRDEYIHQLLAVEAAARRGMELSSGEAVAAVFDDGYVGERRLP